MALDVFHMVVGSRFELFSSKNGFYMLQSARLEDEDILQGDGVMVVRILAGLNVDFSHTPRRKLNALNISYVMAVPNKLSTKSDSFTGNFPYFRQPVEFGYFSHDYERNYQNSACSLKKFRLPSRSQQIHFDLTQGYEQFIDKDDSGAFLNSLLKWLLQNLDKFTTQKDSANDMKDGLNTDFVCWRGLLTKVLCSPYERRDSWKIAVIKFRGTHFLCEFKTEQNKEHERNISEREKHCRYWGLKFEQFLCLGEGQTEIDTSSPVNSKEDYASVVRTRLERHSLVYAGEVDCFDVKDGKKYYVELKTQRHLSNKRAETSFKVHKLKKWWAQSFLLGIPRITCGFRDDNGIVTLLKDYRTLELPSYAKLDVYRPWDPCVCFNFLNEFLSLVKDTVKLEGPRQAYLFEFSPDDNFVSVQDVGDNPEYCFLPEWFYDRKSSKIPTELSSNHKRGSKKD